jgi:hypothetical protein
MSTHALRPWTDLVKLHPDVEAGALTEAVFAIDLGAIAAGDPNVPVVYRDPEEFFRATYLTADLAKLLQEVLASLAGSTGYNRVLKLRTPFGGGKSHTLAALLHAARHPDALDAVPEARSFPRPRDVAVAVFDGEKFDARNGKELPDGRTIRTMWGWIAWQIGPQRAFALVEGHDRDRVAPGGDVIRKMLTEGAGGRPVLILLDEVLKYMERAGAVPVSDSTLQRQAKDFFQNLTVEVAGSRNAALVYSLTWSARESLGNVGLLSEIDKLAARVDQLREPVTGDEILPILQRRLLAEPPDPQVARQVAAAYAKQLTQMRMARAENPSEQQEAEEQGRHWRERLQRSYPFHPALVDLMRERWTAVDAFQRTRGALRFLASCMYSLKKQGTAGPLLSPGDVPLHDPEVRMKMLKELGVQNDYDPVILADIHGPNARAKRIDDRLSRERPELGRVRPATRLATAILLYSFGGLKRNATEGSQTLPPGVTQEELFEACLAPDLDNITATSVLSELLSTCLYLHHDGTRYCFKKDPNVTKLIEDAEQVVAQEETDSPGHGPVRERLKAMLEAQLAGHREVVVWPERSLDIPDQQPLFLVAYLPLEFAEESREEQERRARDYFSRCGDKPRRYRNGLGLAIPDKKQIEGLRRAVRYLLAIERVEGRKQQLRLTRDQLDQLNERKRTEQAAAMAALRDLYTAVWLPRMEGGQIEIERVERSGRPLQATGVHERIMELLIRDRIPRVYESVTPHKIIERVRLGEPVAQDQPPVLGIPTAEVLESFFRDLAPPRITSADVLRKAIVRGVSEGIFGYASGGTPALGPDGKFQIAPDKVTLGRQLREDEIDLESGFLMLAAAVPHPSTTSPTQGATTGAGPQPQILSEPPGGGPPGGQIATTRKTHYRTRFKATRDQLFKIFPALSELADKSDEGMLTVSVEAVSSDGFDPVWLRNAVEEPLDEAGVQRSPDFQS